MLEAISKMRISLGGMSNTFPHRQQLDKNFRNRHIAEVSAYALPLIVFSTRQSHSLLWDIDGRFSYILDSCLAVEWRSKHATLHFCAEGVNVRTTGADDFASAVFDAGKK